MELVRSRSRELPFLEGMLRSVSRGVVTWHVLTNVWVEVYIFLPLLLEESDLSELISLCPTVIWNTNVCPNLNLITKKRNSSLVRYVTSWSRLPTSQAGQMSHKRLTMLSDVKSLMSSPCYINSVYGHPHIPCPRPLLAEANVSELLHGTPLPQTPRLLHNPAIEEYCP